MGQKRYWNWKDDDATDSLNRRLMAAVPYGRYRGYDAVLGGSMNLVLEHTVSGFDEVDINLNHNFQLGMAVSKQGVVVVEDAPIQLPVNPNGGILPRIDLIVMEHEYIPITGGQPAIYKVLEGTPAANPVAPALTPEEKQVVLGELYLPAGTAALSDAGVVYTQATPPNFNGNPDAMLLGAVQTSTAEKTFSTLAHQSGELVYDAPNFALVPAVPNEPRNIWHVDYIDNTPRVFSNINLGATYNDGSNHNDGRIVHIVCDQDLIYAPSLASNVFVLQPSLTWDGVNGFPINRGDTITLMDVSDKAVDWGWPVGVPLMIIIGGLQADSKRINKWTKAQYWDKHNGNPTPDGSGFLELDHSGNYVEVEFPSAGGDLKYISDASATQFPLNPPSHKGGALLVLRIKQPVVTGNVVMHHNETQLWTHKPILNKYPSDVVLQDGDMVVLIEDNDYWRVVAVYNYDNPFQMRDFITAVNGQLSTLNQFMSDYTPETWKRINTAGNMDNGEPIPTWDAQVYAGFARIRRKNPTDIEFNGITANVNNVSLGSPSGNLFNLPNGYHSSGATSHYYYTIAIRIGTNEQYHCYVRFNNNNVTFYINDPTIPAAANQYVIYLPPNLTITQD